MRRLWLFLLLIPFPALAATQEAPHARLDPLPDRILFLVAVWSIIIALVIILRWKIHVADALFRMMPKDQGEPAPANPNAPPPLPPSAKHPKQQEKQAPPPS